MPLPWKKKKKNEPKSKKINRVSRFVNEIRSSSRHGESMVVQTGFPTSLIDLFVKNRDRLNSQSSKKKTNRVSEVLEIESKPFLALENRVFDDIEEEREELKIGDDDVPISVERKRFSVIFIVNVVFVMIVLAFGSKKLAFTVTLSAFLLLFVELLFKSCPSDHNHNTNFVDFREEFYSLVEEKKKGGKIDCDLVEDKKSILENAEEEKEEAIVGTGKLGRSKRRDSAKLRAKQFKKYVTKKFGGESKNRRNSEGKLDLSNVVCNCVTGNEKIQDMDEEGNEDNDDDDENDSISVSEVKSDVGFREKSGKGTNWSSIAFVSIVIIVAGLVGFRVMAMVLSIVCLSLGIHHKLLGAKLKS